MQEITIVGGGTAGWMAAAILSRYLAKHWRITLVESEEIGTVGVGEATIPQLQILHRALGIDEAEFLSFCNGTYKLGIDFVGWGDEGSRYIHAFGEIGRPLGLVPFHHYWLRGNRLGMAKPLTAYSLNASAAYAGKFQHGAPSGSVLGGLGHAFHFDAGLYGQFLRAYAEKRGVRRVEGRILSVARDGESGDVTHVTLASGEEVGGHLFLDCSGFVGLLIEGALGTGYEDWRHWLPCDRAMAVPCANAPDLTPYTRSTAREAGWQWRIPLQSRIGNGHVYCSDFTSDDAARQVLLDNLDGAPLAEPRALRFTTGRRRKMWNHNVVALGLASGFMEPLESTSIHLVQSGVERLLKFLPQGPAMAADVDAFNAQAAFEYEAIRDFLILHYKVNRRPEPFWQACAAMDIPDSLAAKLALFEANGRIMRQSEELFAEVGWLQVMVGQGLVPHGYHPLADQPADGELREFLQLLETAVARQVAGMGSHADVIACQRAPAASRSAAF
ncbi:MAG: tryptophan 7-halogenase [Sphingomonadales bacterium]|nr:tryptophan 7-halogenase [Sphingomonadales bacterium]MDE2167892.1 tryptophan 7-halogenase [Sphingomonadales bacterium]